MIGPNNSIAARRNNAGNQLFLFIFITFILVNRVIKIIQLEFFLKGKKLQVTYEHKTNMINLLL